MLQIPACKPSYRLVASYTDTRLKTCVIYVIHMKSLHRITTVTTTLCVPPFRIWFESYFRNLKKHLMTTTISQDGLKTLSRSPSVGRAREDRESRHVDIVNLFDRRRARDEPRSASVALAAAVPSFRPPIRPPGRRNSASAAVGSKLESGTSEPRGGACVVLRG